MMDYEVFKNVVTTRIKDFLPSIYAEFGVSIERVPKINGMKEAMIIAFEAENCRMSGPNIYLDDLYRDFIEHEDMDFVLKDTASKIMAFTGTQMIGEKNSIKLEDYKGDIVKMMINTEKNKELLELAPHKSYLDLSVVYRMVISDMDGNGYSTALITNGLMEELGITLDELDALAEYNSRSKLATKVMSVAPGCYMMITTGMIFGAINIQRLDEIKKISDEIESDLYLLPSSIHDLMVFDVNGPAGEKELFDMVREGNELCNDEDEFLSNSVYYYNRTKNALELRCCG